MCIIFEIWINTLMLSAYLKNFRNSIDDYTLAGIRFFYYSRWNMLVCHILNSLNWAYLLAINWKCGQCLIENQLGYVRAVVCAEGALQIQQHLSSFNVRHDKLLNDIIWKSKRNFVHSVSHELFFMEACETHVDTERCQCDH